MALGVTRVKQRWGGKTEEHWDLKHSKQRLIGSQKAEKKMIGEEL